MGRMICLEDMIILQNTGQLIFNRVLIFLLQAENVKLYFFKHFWKIKISSSVEDKNCSNVIVIHNL